MREVTSAARVIETRRNPMTFNDLAQERYISLTTFKRDGTPVSAPVWVAGDEGRLLVWTADSSWKVKRIRRDGHVRVAPCTMRGKIRGEGVDAEATILDDTSLVQKLEARKYGWRMRVIGRMIALGRKIRREPTPESVTLVITDPGARERTTLTITRQA
jgi:PPOX class probable F420-dependent enzyme